MKRIIVIALGLIFLVAGISILNGCSTSNEMIAAKSGAQLWGENCVRCHNIPSPETFSNVQWDVAVMHMRIRANLTEDEAQKITEFLKSAN
jgi:cytochrome c1